jgi:hypothetical protein
VHFYSTFWRSKRSNWRTVKLWAGQCCATASGVVRAGASAAPASESGPSRRSEAALPEVGSTPSTPGIRAPPRGALALAARRALCCPPVRRRLPTRAGRGHAVRRVKAGTYAVAGRARMSTIKRKPPAAPPSTPQLSPHPLLHAAAGRHEGCSVSAPSLSICRRPTATAPPWDPEDAAPAAHCPNPPRPRRNFPPPRWPAPGAAELPRRPLPRPLQPINTTPR